MGKTWRYKLNTGSNCAVADYSQARRQIGTEELIQDLRLRLLMNLRTTARKVLFRQLTSASAVHNMKRAQEKVFAHSCRNRRNNKLHAKGLSDRTQRLGRGKPGLQLLWSIHDGICDWDNEDSVKLEATGKVVSEAKLSYAAGLERYVADKWKHDESLIAATPGIGNQWQVVPAEAAQTFSRGAVVPKLAMLGIRAASEVASFLPLHDYFALEALSTSVPGSVTDHSLLYAMGEIETAMERMYQYAKRSRKCTAGFVDKFLISVWDDAADFLRSAHRDCGKLLANTPTSSSHPAVADKTTFINRLHARTGGVLRRLNWDNLCALGGMIVGCLVADDNEFKERYHGLDIDIFLVGVSGTAFKSRIAAIVHAVHAEARALGISASVVRTPMTITMNFRTSAGTPLPNVQIVKTPFLCMSHLVFTSAMDDCTAMAFNGQNLFASPRAREAIASRRNIVRPGKYHIRGYWHTESRLLKYAMRGFRVVDIGLPSYVESVDDACSAALGHMVLEISDRVRERFSAHQPIKCLLEKSIARIKQKMERNIAGARLLLLSQQNAALHQLLIFDAPILRGGMSVVELKSVASAVGSEGHDAYGRVLSRSKFELICCPNSDESDVWQAAFENAQELDATDPLFDHPHPEWYANLTTLSCTANVTMTSKKTKDDYVHDNAFLLSVNANVEQAQVMYMPRPRAKVALGRPMVRNCGTLF